jgi:hypothetical protein
MLPTLSQRHRQVHNWLQTAFPVGDASRSVEPVQYCGGEVPVSIRRHMHGISCIPQRAVLAHHPFPQERHSGVNGGVLHFGKPPVPGRSTPTFWAPSSGDRLKGATPVHNLAKIAIKVYHAEKTLQLLDVLRGEKDLILAA